MRNKPLMNLHGVKKRDPGNEFAGGQDNTQRSAVTPKFEPSEHGTVQDLEFE